MGGLRVIGCGYRDWSIRVFNDIKKINGIKLKVLTSSNDVTLEVIDNFCPDVILFYGWSWIIPDEIIDKYLCLCLHPSPLPKYRGGSPIQHQIIAGEKTSAVSIFKMTNELDAGPLCFHEEFSLDGNISEIFKKISNIGINATHEILEKIKNNSITFYPQKEEDWPVYKRRKPHESEITIEEIKTLSAKQLHDKIRMLTGPYPNSYIVCGDGNKLFITSSHLKNESQDEKNLA